MSKSLHNSDQKYVSAFNQGENQLYSSTKKYNLRNRNKTVNDEIRDFTCRDCDFVATKPLLLDWHMLTKHKSDNSTEENTKAMVKDNPDENISTKQGTTASTCLKKYKCTECTYSTAQLKKFKQHIKSVHGNIKEPLHKMANTFDKINMKSATEKRHKIATTCTNDKIKMRSSSVKIKADVKEEEAIEVRKEFQCSKCSFKSPERIGITNHIKSSHSKLGVVKCIKSCNRTFSTMEELTGHKKIMHPKKWVCKLCPKGYDSTKQFCDHVMRHHSDRRSSPSDPTMSQGEILLFAEENAFVTQYTKFKVTQPNIVKVPKSNMVKVAQPNMVKVPQSTKVREEVMQEPEIKLPKPAWIDIVDKMMAPMVPRVAYQVSIDR